MWAERSIAALIMAAMRRSIVTYTELVRAIGVQEAPPVTWRAVLVPVVLNLDSRQCQQRVARTRRSGPDRPARGSLNRAFRPL
jgi:hypothetical protein